MAVFLPSKSALLEVLGPGRWLRAGGFWLIASLAGCAAATSAERGSEGDAGGPPPLGTADTVSVRFETEAPLKLAPREQKAVVVRVSPPATYSVRFALRELDEEARAASSHDASLGDSEVVTDTLGRAAVRLTAPSTPTSALTLEAHVGSITASLPLSVLSGTGSTLYVETEYGGLRSVSEWIVSVHEGSSCEELGPGVPADGDPVARVSRGDIALIDVDSTAAVAVVARAGQFAAGCTNLSDATPEPETRVLVKVGDRPLRLEDTLLDVSLGLPDGDATFAGQIQAGLALVVDGLRGDNATDAEALLDAMRLTLPVARQGSFEVARAAQDWNALLVRAPFQGNASRLRDAVTRWVNVGRGPLFSARAFEGHLAADASDPALGQLTLERLGGVAASAVDLAVESSSWAADAADTLVFGGQASWNPSKLVAALAEGPALAETGAGDVPSALAVVAGCAQVGGALESSDAVFAASCDAACLETACRNALVNLWDASANADTRVELSIAATGGVSVGELAQATGVTGTWVGRLANGAGMAETGGPVAGFAPKYAAR